MAQHRAVKSGHSWGRLVLIAATTALLTAGTAGTASAHNHVLNPSGACNANGGPGNADALVNPGGHTPDNRDIPRHAIDVAHGADNCANNR